MRHAQALICLWMPCGTTEKPIGCSRFAIDKFEKHHLNRPAIFSNRNLAMRGRWNATEVLRRFGNVTLQTTQKRMFRTVASYLHAPRIEVGFEQLFAPSDQAVPLLDGLREEVEGRLPSVLKDLDARRIGSVGRFGTGSMLHRHDSSWLLLTAGNKEWFLLPPGASGTSALESENPCTLQAAFQRPDWIRCMQHAGEVLYLPGGTWHATCNANGKTEDDVVLGIGAQGFKVASNELLYAARDGDVAKIDQICNDSPPRDPEPSKQRSWIESVLNTLFRSWRARLKKRPIQKELTALHVAATHDQAGVAKQLIGGCAAWMVYVPAGSSGGYPVHEAARCGSLQVLEVLLHHDRGLADAGSQPAGLTPLQVAAHFGQVAAVELLLVKNARVGARSVSGMTALHTAAGASQVAVLRSLMRANGDLTRNDSHHRAPVQIALEEGHLPVVEFLLGLESPHGRNQRLIVALTPEWRRAKWPANVIRWLKHATLDADGETKMNSEL